MREGLPPRGLREESRARRVSEETLRRAKLSLRCERLELSLELTLKRLRECLQWGRPSGDWAPSKLVELMNQASPWLLPRRDGRVLLKLRPERIEEDLTAHPGSVCKRRT